MKQPDEAGYKHSGMSVHSRLGQSHDQYFDQWLRNGGLANA